MTNLSNTFVNHGKYAEAEMLCKQCLEKQRSLFGNNHPDCLNTMDCLAKTYSLQGKYAEADVLYKECLEKQKLLFGNNYPDNPNTARTKTGLVANYKRQGKFVEAIAVLKDTV